MSAPGAGGVRAILIGASPSADPAHARAVLGRLKADPARDLFVGVDGGVRSWLEAGYKPHLAIGDWDSLVGKWGKGARAVLAAIHHVSLPADKDRSDLSHAIEAVLAAGATELHCLGVTGGRPDHQLASLHELAGAMRGPLARSLTRVEAYGPEGGYRFLAAGKGAAKALGDCRLKVKRGATASVFAWNGIARGVTLEGFRYPLRDAKLEAGSRGLSNRVTAGECRVRLKEGTLLVLLPAS